MAELREVVRRLKLGHTVRDIHRSTGVHRTIVREITALAAAQGWLLPEAELPEEARIAEARVERRDAKWLSHRLDEHRDRIEGWVSSGYSAVVIHRLIKDQVPCSRPTVVRYLRSRFPLTVEPVMRRATEPGKVMEVDFGYLGLTYDPATGRRRRTWVFSGRLRHSRLAWRERVFDEKGRSFFLCHINAFEYFGVVPERVVPDNTKAAVVKASFEDPIVNRAYRALAEHYGFLIDPCGPYLPRHKGGVESDIKYVKGNFLPVFREQQKERGRDVPYADELAEELQRWSEEVAESRLIKGVGRTPREIFETEERAAMHPLPARRWDPQSWGCPKVGADWRVQFERGFYSVPYRYIGAQVLVYGDSQKVRVYLEGAEIALHQRVQRPWGSSIKDEHAPAHKLQVLNTTREGLLHRAGQLGEPVGKMAQAILAERAVDGIRPVRALIRLAHHYGAQRLAAACNRALLYDTPYYRSVKEILAQGLDRLPLEQPVQSSVQLSFRFERGRGYFEPSTHTN
jgi:transposase